MQDEPKGIHTELVTPTHPYTAVDVPWEIDTEQQNPLYRYLRGGGVRAFGRSSHEVARSRRQTRFLIIFSVLALIWALLLLV